MARDFFISVAMATYNGENYIEKQLKTILDNLEDNDELIISDDGSKDATLDIIKSFNDQRIKLFDGPKKGIKQNFANAISKCSGKYIFLSDQDDVWAKEKVNTVIKAFEETGALVVNHDCDLKLEDGTLIEESYFKFRNCSKGYFKNFVRTTYLGCCMAFDARLKKEILPIPDKIDMHDQWIGLLGDRHNGMQFIPDKLITYVRHEGTGSDCFHHYPVPKMIKNRILLFVNLIKRKKIKAL